MSINQIGPTGKFPQGKLNEHDEGEAFRVGADADGLVVVEFGKPVSWLAMPSDKAIEFAVSLLKAATGGREIEGGKPNG